MSKVLVTGGAGYIGSHTVLALCEAGYDVVVYDNLSSGHAEAVLPPARLVTGDLEDTQKLANLMQEENFHAVLHFAAYIVVPESVQKPLKYYLNNTANTTKLIQACVENNISYFVFSSTAAVYGIPDYVPVNEDFPLQPINPYGRSKLMSEWVLQDASKAYPHLRHIALRYFNVAGADPQGRIGQSTPNATHLIKVACQTVLGQRKQLEIFGTDYPTADGSGIRDYIHVSDLADIHVLALKQLEHGHPSATYNCGYGHGYSVKEIIDSVRRVSQTEFQVREAERRAGDPAELIADPARLNATLQWKPRYDDIDLIVQTALQWESKLVQSC